MAACGGLLPVSRCPFPIFVFRLSVDCPGLNRQTSHDVLSGAVAQERPIGRRRTQE